MDNSHVKALQERVMYGMLNAPEVTAPATISPSTIERDKRSVAKTIRELVEAKYLAAEPNEDGTYNILPRAFDEITVDSVDLIDEYDKRYEPRDRDTQYPYIVVDRLTRGQQKTLLLTADHYEWYAMSELVINYKVALNEAEHVHGDGTIVKAAELVRGSFRLSRNMRLVVTLPKLKQHAKDVEFKRQVNELYPKNLPWGLVKQGVIGEAEQKAFGEALTNPTGDSFFPGSGPKNDPDQWEAMVEGGIDAIIAEIGELQGKLSLLRKVSHGVKEHGGWNKVKATYRQTLIDELTKRLESPEEEEAKATA